MTFLACLCVYNLRKESRVVLWVGGRVFSHKQPHVVSHVFPDGSFLVLSHGQFSHGRVFSHGQFSAEHADRLYIVYRQVFIVYRQVF